ncbi:MAG: BlaI/MecI/CopY family transcriptional regulator, partial [Chloroflexi bacterium]
MSLLGPLEGRLMKLIWDGRVHEPFIVRDVLALTPELAYTTVMTTLNRLADKGLLSVTKMGSHQPHKYRANGGVKIALSSFTETPRSLPSPRVSTGCRRLRVRLSRGCARGDRTPVGPACCAGRGANCLPQHGCRLPAGWSLRLDSDAGYFLVARSLRATAA